MDSACYSRQCLAHMHQKDKTKFVFLRKGDVKTIPKLVKMKYDTKSKTKRWFQLSKFL
jgi:hypothetical protein